MKDLAQRAAELFSPKPHAHNIKTDNLVGVAKKIKYCKKCKGRWGIYDSVESYCSVPDPIDITKLGPALEVFRGLPENLIFEPLIDWARQHCENGEYPIVPVNIMFLMAKGIAFDKATAEEIWEINCEAKESEEK